MFKRGLAKQDAWEGVVTDKRRSSPDGQNMYHRVVVTLSDGNVGTNVCRSTRGCALLSARLPRWPASAAAEWRPARTPCIDSRRRRPTYATLIGAV
jgi:hypothetical protein